MQGLMHESIALEGSWVSHMTGASTLLSLRGQDKIIESPAEFEVSAVCFLQMVRPEVPSPRYHADAFTDIRQLSEWPSSSYTMDIGKQAGVAKIASLLRTHRTHL